MCIWPKTRALRPTPMGLAEAEGEWITLLDHDDALSPNALYEVAKGRL